MDPETRRDAARRFRRRSGAVSIVLFGLVVFLLALLDGDGEPRPPSLAGDLLHLLALLEVGPLWVAGVLGGLEEQRGLLPGVTIAHPRILFGVLSAWAWGWALGGLARYVAIDLLFLERLVARRRLRRERRRACGAGGRWPFRDGGA